MRIGLYGGSFHPAHAGHLHVTTTALRRLGLDRVWWLVTPGNPLKRGRPLAPLSQRCAQAAEVARADPRIAVTGFEAAIGARFTRDALHWLVRRRPARRFVWIMGADSLGTFHRWKGSAEIMGLMPIAVIDRPGHTLSALSARAALRFAGARIPEPAALALADMRPPAWIYLHGPRSGLSSTQIRDAGPRATAT
ncbi:nicotinate-nucleotide adenylyltransferase [uncultured Methylobacterium sp.]|uniref:nicotinate-nucleotide adenylyltransferase n=1 Tax=uncultured Methylobacterium sp. TaxID=157278 RepID=UPI0035C96E51